VNNKFVTFPERVNLNFTIERDKNTQLALRRAVLTSESVVVHITLLFAQKIRIATQPTQVGSILTVGVSKTNRKAA